MTALGRVTLTSLAQQVAGLLNLRGAAGLDVGTTAGTVAAGDDSRFAANASAAAAAQVAANAALPRAGGTMTGALTLAADPGAPMHAATKAYVDAQTYAVLGAASYSATVAGGVLTERINGVSVTSTISNGTITAIYGAPISQTWTTTIVNGAISTTRTA